MFPAGLEPATFRVWGGRDNHYTTETTMHENQSLSELIRKFLSRTSLTQCIKAARSRALATIAHSQLSTNKKQLTKETHFVSETGPAKQNVPMIRTLWPLQILHAQTHYKPAETFQCAHFSSSHLLSV